MCVAGGTEFAHRWPVGRMGDLPSLESYLFFPIQGGNDTILYASGAKMNRHIGMLLLFRESFIVLAVSLGVFLLSTSGLWGVILGAALVFAAFLISATLRVGDRKSRSNLEG